MPVTLKIEFVNEHDNFTFRLSTYPNERPQNLHVKEGLFQKTWVGFHQVCDDDGGRPIQAIDTVNQNSPSLKKRANRESERYPFYGLREVVLVR